MGRKKRRTIVSDITITGLADKGKGVGRDAEGRVFFVAEVAPGDVVEVEVIKKRKSYIEGKVRRYQTLSPSRIQPFCSHFNDCGGCKFQHISYQDQVLFKEKVVRDAFDRLAKVEVPDFRPILPAKETSYYRNKLEFSFANKIWLPKELLDTGLSFYKNVLGFHKAGAFDKIVDIDHCYLQADPSNQIRNTAREIASRLGYPFYDVRSQKGFFRNMVVRISALGETMVIFCFGQADQNKIKAFLDQFLQVFPNLSSVYYCINTKVNDFLLDLDMHLYHGIAYIKDRLRHVTFQIGPKSFFQTNTSQAVRLYEIVEEFADLQKSDIVYDLYTGLGSIALFLAAKCKHIIGIEEVEAAIEDAKKNQALNQIENASFYAGRVKDVLLPEFTAAHPAPDVLITDPPRAGMHPKVVQMLLTLAPKKLVYVSCNPATQARDLQILKEKYTVEKVQPVDMFPHTHHIENVALLKRREVDNDQPTTP